MSESDLRIALPGGPTVAARLSVPTAGAGPWPTLILFHGAEPADMDATVRGPHATPSANFALLARLLPAHGVAVLRFTKRAGAPITTLIEDAAAVLATARARPEVNGIALYGWSQGARVAAHAAEHDGGVAGLILHAGLATGWPSYFAHILRDVAGPVLRDLDTDHDGQLSVADLAAIPKRATSVAFAMASLAWDPMAPRGTRLNPALDPHGTGRFTIDGIWRRLVDTIVADPGVIGSPALDPTAEPTRGIIDVLCATALPALILHGERDGWVAPSEARTIAAGTPNSELQVLRGLGHSLAPVPSAADDDGGPMSTEAVDRMGAWVRALDIPPDSLPL